MSIHPRRNQARQLKKRMREKHARKSRNIANNTSLRDYVLQLSRGPWAECYEAGGCGMSQVICIRKTHTGYGASVFLLDEFCLGVKDAEILRDVDLSVIANSMREREGRLVSPSYAWKKLNALIAWARELGFEPHAKTYLAMEVFRDVDQDACPETFAFGRPEDGKPMYISGPFDSPDRIRLILNKLQRLGKDNHHFAIALNDAFRHPLITGAAELEIRNTEDAEEDTP